jgi:hypothetical protein
MNCGDSFTTHGGACTHCWYGSYTSCDNCHEWVCKNCRGEHMLLGDRGRSPMEPAPDLKSVTDAVMTWKGES